MSIDPEDLSGGLEDWIGGLPLYQQGSVRRLAETAPDLSRAAEAWLTVRASGDTAPYGGRGRSSLFFETFLDELHDLLCGGDRYQQTRERVGEQLKTGHAAVVASISAAVAPSLGAAAPLIAPAVAIVLTIIGQVGLTTWCTTQERRRDSQAEG